MNDLKLKFHHDEFLRKVVDLALLAQLREMKHRGRILVPNAHTLYGIADETGVLKPREIYVVTLDGKGKRQVLVGAALITRSPALHPGDVQIVEAVDVPASSALQSLHNCVVFSQHGDSGIPSMLSGGDLDGDLFNVIFEPSLWPKGTYTPADYPRPRAIDIGRQVTAHDLQNFFLLFMQTDNLGMIANAHLQCADQKLLQGPLSEECLVLAGMHSTAVDFAKTGLPVNMKLMPNTYARRCKPDFMAPSARLPIGVENVAFEDIEDGADEMEDAVSALDPDRRPIRYYQSTKTLGTLFRSIDDRQFLTQVMKEDPASVAKPVMSELWDYIKAKALLLQWNHLRSAALEIRDTYNTCLEETAWAFTPDNRQPLSELEVFTGIIVGKDGAIPSKRVRESSIDMKEKFARDVAFVTEMVLKGDGGQVDAYSDPAYDGNDASESLERSIAAFAVAMEGGPQYVGHMGHLHSFKYIAAGICVRQIEKRFGFLFLRTKG